EHKTLSISWSHYPEYLLIPRKKLYLRMKKYGLSKEHYKGF
ncbi:hypothetical protein, partial [Klebsiella michiganensis]